MKLRSRSAQPVLFACLAASVLATTPPVWAQVSAPEEIIVTARKRQESILKVPVVTSVLPQAALENYQINDITRLTTKVPGLLLGSGALAIGPQISLRGVGTSSLDAGIDQSVTLNLDGVPMAQGIAYRAGLFDVAQVEVLRGPQALFYGKASTGGVISLRTADPGEQGEIIARAGYELEADEKRAELIFSIPLTETVGFRFAGMVSDMEGFFNNKATALPGGGGLTPKYSRQDDTKSYIVRGTATFKPSPKFDARFKVNFTRENVQGNASHNQMSSCPDGTGAIPGVGIQFMHPNENCKLDRDIYVVDLDPAQFPGVRNNGVPFLLTRQKFGSLEMNFHPTDDLILSSVTGFYNVKSDVFINSSTTGYAATYFVTDNSFKRRDFTQELRFESDFKDFPVNFTVGGFYQDAQQNMTVRRFINQAPASNPFRTAAAGTNGGRTTGYHDIDIKTVAVFGQVRWKPLEQLEIAGGARYTDEKRDPTLINITPGALVVNVPIGSPASVNPQIRAKNWSPELTITYLPTDDLTIFGSVKQGYKSGGFSLTQLYAPNFNNSFGDERVRGGEVGLKSRLLDRSLNVNAAAYLYKYKGLQVGTSETNPVTGLPLARTLNAGGAKVYGLEIDFTYRPPTVEGLTLTGAVNWTHARFTELNFVPCWPGQLVSEGCNQTRNPANGLFTAQGLTGMRLVRAPDWQIQGGVDYETPIAGGNMTLAFGTDGQYSSEYPTNLNRREDGIQRGFFIFNANIALRGQNDGWEVSVIGNNIANKITTASCTPTNYAGGSGSVGVITGGTVRGAAGGPEVGCFARRGREAWVRLTLRPMNLF